MRQSKKWLGNDIKCEIQKIIHLEVLGKLPVWFLSVSLDVEALGALLALAVEVLGAGPAWFLVEGDPRMELALIPNSDLVAQVLLLAG